MLPNSPGVIFLALFILHQWVDMLDHPILIEECCLHQADYARSQQESLSEMTVCSAKATFVKNQDQVVKPHQEVMGWWPYPLLDLNAILFPPIHQSTKLSTIAHCNQF